MNEYKPINGLDTADLSKEELLQKYNDAVAEIHHLNTLLAKLREENDAWIDAYEEVSNQLYG